jgi:cell division protein ZipA
LAAELRWILLGLSLPLLAGIWWWTARRSSQAPGNAALREPTPHSDPRYADSDDDEMTPEPQTRDWGVPPFEPLNIRTAEFDRVPGLDGPMLVNADPEPATTASNAGMGSAVPTTLLVSPTVPISTTLPASTTLSASTTLPASTTSPVSTTLPASTTSPVSTTRPASIARSATDNGERFATAAPAAPNGAEQQRIVTIRVCTVGEARWSGVELMAALELHGLAFGRYQVFHRKHVDGRSLFCVASLIEPGTFDVAAMPQQEFRGVTLFAVLPGPVEPLETMDELFGTARGLAEELSGMVQDGKGMPLSPQRAAAMREDVARFQASLPGH